MATTPTINQSVFDPSFKHQANFNDWLIVAEKSPYLVDLLNKLASEHHTVRIGTAGGGTYTQGHNITIDPSMLPTINSEATNKQFISMLAHEAGHAALPDHSLTNAQIKTPRDAAQSGLAGEGVAISTEYIVATQLGGRMHSDTSGIGVRADLDLLAANHGINLTSRRLADHSSALTSFDNAARQKGSDYYGTLHPSTAKNIDYKEYYGEYFAYAQATGRNPSELDLVHIQSNAIRVVPVGSHGDYNVIGHNVPLLNGKTANFETHFNALGQPTNTINVAVSPTTSMPAPISENHLSKTHQSLIADSEKRVHSLYKEYGLTVDKGTQNTVMCVAVAAAEQGMCRIDRAAVKDGNINIAQMDGAVATMASVNGNIAANTPVEQSLSKLTAIEQQQTQSINNPSQTIEQPKQGRSIG
jgi:hypothetical protein